MGRIRVYNILSNLIGTEFFRYASALLQEITQQINGNLSFVENITASGPHVLSFTNSAGQIITVEHTLGKVPLGHITVSTGNQAAIIYRANETVHPWTATKAFFVSSVTATYSATVYLI